MRGRKKIKGKRRRKTEEEENVKMNRKRKKKKNNRKEQSDPQEYYHIIVTVGTGNVDGRTYRDDSQIFEQMHHHLLFQVSTALNLIGNIQYRIGTSGYMKCIVF